MSPANVSGNSGVGFDQHSCRDRKRVLPCQPSNLIPPALLAKATKFIEGSSKSGVIKRMMKEGSAASKAVRGCELTDFSTFLKEKDAECRYSSFLRRVCDKSTGMAMWVTEASAKAMEEANDAHDDSEDVKLLKTANSQLEQENVTLKQKIETLKETSREHSPDPIVVDSATDKCSCAVS